MPDTDLLIEHGQLLKRYVLPWRESGYQPPPGWTPADDEWTEARIAELMAGWEQVLDRPASPEIARKQALDERGKMMQERRKPWPGWVPTNPRDDPDITRAYRELFQRINPELKPPTTQKMIERVDVIWPGDGRYVYKKGEMRRIDDE